MSARSEQILDVAEQVLERTGFEGFGVGELARELQIKPPSLYKHFASLTVIEHALISRGLRALGDALEVASGLEGFCRAYREQALAAPQLYRLMTERPLDRALLDAGAEAHGMRSLLELFGESVEHHPVSRAAWAAAHGLVALEITGRFPPDADVGDSWRVLVAMLQGVATSGADRRHG